MPVCRRPILLALVTAWLPCMTLSMAVAGDWPQYRGPDGTGRSAETANFVEWPTSGPKVVWKQPTPLGFSSFAIADGMAFTLVSRENADGGMAQTCIALDANTGKELWAYALSASKFSGGGNAGAPGNRGGDGPRSTPTVDQGRVYLYDAQMKLYCLKAEEGQLLWQRDVIQEFAGRNIAWENATSPVIDGNSLFIGGGGAGQSMLAFNKLDGQVIWKTGDERFTHANPVITSINRKKQLIYFMQSGLVAVDPTNGQELWRTAFPFSTSAAALPVVDGNLVYCSAGYGVGAGLFRVNGSPEPEMVWRKPNQLMNHWSTPVVYQGHLYGIFEFKKYGKAPLQCVDLATGEIKWKKRGFGPGNCILVGDKVVALSDAGELVIAEADPEQYQELARAKVLDGKCWSTPAYSNGRLYLRSTEEGACVELN